MKKYPEYKNSGINWIGEIPNHWYSKRLKYSTELIVSNVDKRTNENEIKVRLCNYSDVYKNDIIKESLDFMVGSANDKEFEKFKLINGDVIITKDSESPDDIAIPAYVPKDFSDTVCGYHLAIIRQTGKISGKYLFYLFKSYKFNQQFTIAARGITRFGLSYASIANAYVSVPTTTEQTVITNFLDHKTQLIDNLITKKERLIELLQEERTAMINQAVTKGLDPNVPMKDSGIVWLGEMPEHWEVKRLKYLGKSIIGLTYSPNDIVENGNSGNLVLRASNIQNGKLDFNDNVYVKKDIPNKLIICKGDILICSRSGSKALIGKNICIDESAIGYSFGAFMTVFRSKHYSYLTHIFNSEIFVSQSELFLTTTINQLTIQTLNNLIIAYPNSEHEKESISQYIIKINQQIEESIDHSEKEIKLLSEYKTSLINEAVTGKIDVRDYKLNHATN